MVLSCNVISQPQCNFGTMGLVQCEVEHCLWIPQSEGKNVDHWVCSKTIFTCIKLWINVQLLTHELFWVLLPGDFMQKQAVRQLYFIRWIISSCMYHCAFSIGVTDTRAFCLCIGSDLFGQKHHSINPMPELCSSMSWCMIITVRNMVIKSC